MNTLLHWWNKHWKATLGVLVVVLINAFVLKIYGQPGTAQCAPVALWTGTVNGCENSQQMTDWYIYPI